MTGTVYHNKINLQCFIYSWFTELEVPVSELYTKH